MSFRAAGERTFRLCAALLTALAVPSGLAAEAVDVGRSGVLLPNGWMLSPPRGVVATGTMPQGMAASPNHSVIAVVESGYNPPTLALYRVPGLTRARTIALPGAFGRPLWRDASHVLVPGANADALLDVNVVSGSVRVIRFPRHSYPIAVAVAPNRVTYAVASDGDGSVRIGTLDRIGAARPIAIGGHPGGLVFARNGHRVFATVRSSDALVTIDAASRNVRRLPVGLHPSAVALLGDALYVAITDGDAVVALDERTGRRRATISVGDRVAGTAAIGVSPSALFVSSNRVFVALGAANSIALLQNGRLTGRLQAGWYPTDVLSIANRLYVLDGKGEGARPNPRYRSRSHDDTDYIGAIESGSLRSYDLAGALGAGGNPQGATLWNAAHAATVVRPHGPIRHVFFVLKENRSYDQILGDMAAGNGDPTLAWFGARVTPNEHALAARFGLYDNAYASGEVSASGHMWADAAFANDYLERFWPSLYGGRRNVDDLSGGDGPRVPAGGYLWDAARRAHVSFRDYGELADRSPSAGHPWVADVSSLRGQLDPRYVGWDLDYSDLSRASEWAREFKAFVRAGTLPNFEFIWLPNDHTYGSKVGKFTPRAYIATNDLALGRMVDTLTHSPVWRSSAMFVIEDDAQDGPDHVSDQRTTLFVISPYARAGTHNEHYATVSVLRTIELMLGMAPLSTYDAMATPMYDSFASSLALRTYRAIDAKVPLTERSTLAAYGSHVSEQLDFSQPDAAPVRVLGNILAHNH